MLLVFVALSGTVFSQGHEDDVEGAEDHPLISRFPGSVIRYYETRAADEFIIPLGEDVGEYDEDGEPIDARVVVGDITRIQYEAPEDTSTLEIYNNYESALKQAGFDILFSGDREELGWFWTRKIYLRDIIPLPGRESGLAVSEEDFRYLTAEYIDEEDELGDIYISFCTTSSGDGIGIQLDIVEIAPPDQDLIEVNVDNLERYLDEKGSVSIYDIYFDTGESELKAESEAALSEIAEFLTQNPELNLYVVGHTDSSGGYELNMELSLERAEAVMEALVEDYDIDRDRLNAKGVGFLAPVATNETEKGRSLNRRVELVKP